MIKKVKKVKPIEVKVEPIVELIGESEEKKELRKCYAAAKLQDPEGYAMKEKDKELERELAKL